MAIRRVLIHIHIVVNSEGGRIELQQESALGRAAFDHGDFFIVGGSTVGARKMRLSVSVADIEEIFCVGVQQAEIH